MPKKIDGIYETVVRFKKDTPGYYVYTEEGDDPPINNLYIKRGAFGGNAPPILDVIIKPRKKT